MIEVKKNKLGWGGVVKHTTRPYAVFVNGAALETRNGATRTFETRDAARKAGEAHLKGLLP